MKTIDCGDCGESVPYGRLSCPACGALLASVTGPRRQADAVAPTTLHLPEIAAAVQPEIDVMWASDPALPELPVVAPALAAVEPMIALAVVEPAFASAPEPAEPAFARAPEPEVADATPLAPEPPPAPAADRSPDHARLMWLASRASTGSFLLPDTDPPDDGWDHVEHDTTVDIAAADHAVDEPATAPVVAPWSAEPGPAPFLAPRPYERRTAPEPFPAASSVPSAYRAPALSLAMAGPSAKDAGLKASGLTGIGRSIGRALGSDAPAGGKDAAAPTHDVDAERFVEIGGWFVVVGATMTVLGFVLPWSRSVIGATGVGSYFDTWGLATPTNVLVFAGLLAVLGLGIVRTAVPDWIRTGVLGLISGSLVIGLAVPYVAGPLGADVGIMVAGLGGLALVIGGAVASWAARHAEADLPV